MGAAFLCGTIFFAKKNRASLETPGLALNLGAARQNVAARLPQRRNSTLCLPRIIANDEKSCCPLGLDGPTCQTVQRLSKKCRRIEPNEHLGNIDCSSLRCNPACNATEDRQGPQTRPTASNPCPQRRKSNLYGRSPEVPWHPSAPFVDGGIGTAG